MSRKEKQRRLGRRIALAAAASLMLLGLTGVLVLRVRFSGERLARSAEAFLGERIRGDVSVRAIDWPLSRLYTLAAGGWLPVEIRDLEVRDEFGDVVLKTDYARAEIDPHAALLDQQVILRRLELPEGGYALIKQVTEPQPVHEYDRHTTSLMLALRWKSAPTIGAGLSAEPSTVIDIRDYHLQSATVEFSYPGFHGVAYGVKTRDIGFLRYDGRDPIARKLYYSLNPVAERARIFSPIPVTLSELQVQRLAQIPDRWPAEAMPRDVVYEARGRTALGADIHLAGRMKDFWIDYFGGEHELDLEMKQADAIARAYTGGALGGEDLDVFVRMRGPTIVPKVELSAHDLELDVPVGTDLPPLALAVDRTAAFFDLATEAGELEETVARGGGGEIHVAARFDLDPTSLDITLEIPEPIDLSPYLPARVARLAGTRLGGKLHAFGNPSGQRIDELDLSLGRARITGSLSRTDDGLIEAHGVDVSLGGSRLTRIEGVIDVESRALDVAFGVTSTDLARWLGFFDLPRLATSVRGAGSVRGSFDDPRARGSLVLRGVPVVSRLEANLGYRGGVLAVREAQSSAFHGWLRGSGKVDLRGPEPRLRDVEAQAVKLELSRLPGAGPFLAGAADLELSAEGPLSRPAAHLSARLQGWSLAGDPYRDATIEAKSARDGSRSLSLRLERLSGGELDLDGRVSGRGELGGGFRLSGLPVSSILSAAGADPTAFGGTLNAKLDLAGTTERPSASGAVTVLGAWLRGAFLGSADLQVERTDDARIQVSGSIFQGKIRVEGMIATLPPFDSDLTVSVRRLELDLLAPELAETYGARSWVSGELTWEGSLLPDQDSPPRIAATLTEAVVLLESEDAAGRPAPIRLKNRTPVSLAFDGDALALREPAVFAGPAGDFELRGEGTLDALNFEASGRIAVRLLQPYLQEYFEHTAGTLDLSVRLTGSADSPRLSGVLQVENVAVTPRGQEAIVGVPRGKIEFTNDQLAITGLRVVVLDEFSEESAELTVAGGVRLENFVPQLWAVRADGELAGKMLLVAFPEIFSAASGSADVSVALLGVGRVPGIDGSIEFRPEDALKLTPRGLRRDVALTTGSVRFTDDLVELERVGGWVDDEGELVGVQGEVSLSDWKPEGIDITVTARDLPFRIPRELELSLNFNRLRLLGGFEHGLELHGTVEVVDGRYIRNWSPFQDALRPSRIAESDPPVWQEVPLIANTDLNLNLVTRAFFVKNNMANIELGGSLQITGTPADPRFEGVVRVEQGSFKFQGIRAEFTRTNGQITFSRFQEFPDDTPYLQIQSESEYRDINGKDHLVTLGLQGTIANLNWDLATNTGLNKAQTLVLISAGRTPDDARQSLLGDEPIGRRPGDFGSDRTTAEGEGSLYAVDQVAKDLFGDFFALLIEDPIRNVTTFDVARLELGTASIGFRGEKSLTKNLRMVGEIDRSLRGWSWDVRGEYKLTDSFSADGEYLKKNFDDDAQDDESNLRLRFTWRKILLP